jgi:ribosomal protein L32
MPPMSAEATVSRNYLDWLIAVPWFKKTKESRDLKRAEQILNEDHYGLEKDQGPHPRVSRRRALIEEAEGDDPHLLRPSGCRQDLAGKVDRARDEPQFRAAVARRRSRRSGDSRPSAHLHRRLPRADHPDDEEGRAR